MPVTDRTVVTLNLAVNTEYFEAIKARLKTEEYRLVKPYWAKRLENRYYSHVCITKGYPKKNNVAAKLIFEYGGFVKKVITHKHFGSDPVEVYAIALQELR